MYPIKRIAHKWFWLKFMKCKCPIRWTMARIIMLKKFWVPDSMVRKSCEGRAVLNFSHLKEQKEIFF